MLPEIGSHGIFNAKMLRFAVPQLTVGSVRGTDAFVRFVLVPKIGENKIPPTTLWGVGVRHSISQSIPLIPVPIAAQVLYSKMKNGDIYDASGLAYGVQVGKTFSVLSLYGGFKIENSTLKVAYVSTEAWAFKGQYRSYCRAWPEETHLYAHTKFDYIPAV